MIVPVLLSVPLLVGAWQQATAQVATATPDAATPAPASTQDYETAIAALQAGQFERARALLLGVVRRDPDFAGAWLDLAIATQRSGDIAQAEEFLDLLERRFTVPPPLQRAVAELRERIRQGEQGRAVSAAAPLSTVQPAEPRWRTRTQAQWSGGHDGNANAGLSASAISLTFPGGSISLPLADNFRPRADAFWAGQLSWEATLDPIPAAALGAVRAEVGFSARSLSYRREHAFSTDEVQFSTALNWPGPWRASASVQHLQLGGEALVTSAGGALRRAWPTAPCQPQASLELDRRHFENNPNLHSRLWWVGLQGTCAAWPGGPAGHRSLWQLRFGHEAGLSAAEPGSPATTARPGGNTVHRELALLQRWALPGLPQPLQQAQPPKLEALLQFTHSRDTAPYSPLLANNAHRQVRRLAAGLTLTVPLGTTLALTAGAQAYRQVSNLEIFGLSGRLLILSLQKQW